MRRLRVLRQKEIETTVLSFVDHVHKHWSFYKTHKPHLARTMAELVRYVNALWRLPEGARFLNRHNWMDGFCRHIGDVFRIRNLTAISNHPIREALLEMIDQCGLDFADEGTRVPWRGYSKTQPPRWQGDFFAKVFRDARVRLGLKREEQRRAIIKAKIIAVDRELEDLLKQIGDCNPRNKNCVSRMRKIVKQRQQVAEHNARLFAALGW